MDYGQLIEILMLKGEAGGTIDRFEKTSTSGLVDTYTIYMTDGTSHTFEVTNGSSIQSIAKTSTSGLTDTYTITLTNGQTTTFQVTNGEITSAYLEERLVDYEPKNYDGQNEDNIEVMQWLYNDENGINGACYQNQGTVRYATLFYTKYNKFFIEVRKLTTGVSNDDITKFMVDFGDARLEIKTWDEEYQAYSTRTILLTDLDDRIRNNLSAITLINSTLTNINNALTLLQNQIDNSKWYHHQIYIQSSIQSQSTEGYFDLRLDFMSKSPNQLTTLQNIFDNLPSNEYYHKYVKAFGSYRMSNYETLISYADVYQNVGDDVKIDLYCNDGAFTITSSNIRTITDDVTS